VLLGAAAAAGSAAAVGCAGSVASPQPLSQAAASRAGIQSVRMKLLRQQMENWGKWGKNFTKLTVRFVDLNMPNVTVQAVWVNFVSLIFHRKLKAFWHNEGL